MTMPDTPSEQLAEAVRLERAGLLDKALQQFEAAAGSDDHAIVAESLRHQADIHRARCDWDTALERARRSEAVSRGAGRDDLLAEALNAQAAVHLSRSAYDDAEKLLRRMLEIGTQPRIRGIALQNLGLIAAERGLLEDAHRYFLDSSGCFEAAGYDRGVATALINSSRIPLLRGQNELAAQQAARAEETARNVGDLELVALACLTLGEAMLRLERLDEAERAATTALGYFSGVGNDWRRVECLRLYGDLHRAAGDRGSAARCYRRGLELAREVGATLEADRLRIRLGGLLAPSAGRQRPRPRDDRRGRARQPSAARRDAAAS